MDEQELERQQFLNGWDRQSCAEFEAWLDEVNDERFAQERDNPDNVPCECLQIDVDLFDNRNCLVRGPKARF